MADDDLWYGELNTTVRVQDLPASRNVVAIERQANGEWRVCGSGASTSDGVANFAIRGLPASRIYAVAVDEWGLPFAPGLTVSYGDVIRPTQFLGWMYQVTQPGVLPVEEPDWWNAMAGIPRPVGTAMLQAVRHYQPIGHGPVDVEWEERESDPYWNHVVALLQFEDGFYDAAGGVWAATGNAHVTSLDPLMGGGSLDVSPLSGRSGLQISGKPELAFGTGDFAVEVLFKIRNLTRSNTLIDFRPPVASGAHLLIQVDNGGIYTWASGGYRVGPIYGLIGEGEKVWLAVQRVSGVMQIYINGMLAGQAIDATNYISSQCSIGINRNTQATESRFDLDGQVDEVRITNGVARISGNYTPLPEPFPVG